MRGKTDNKAFSYFKENVTAEIKSIEKKISGNAKQSVQNTQLDIQRGLRGLEQKLGHKMQQAIQQVTDVRMKFVIQIIDHW